MAAGSGFEYHSNIFITCKVRNGKGLEPPTVPDLYSRPPFHHVIPGTLTPQFAD